jgi:hypothetical protein
MAELTGSSLLGRCSRWPAIAVVPLLVWVVLAPEAAWAGCSHLVRSRDDRVQLPSLLQGETSEGASGPASPLPPSTPWSPAPCKGAWCSDAPSVPAAPVEMIRFRAESWACLTAVADPNATLFTRLLEEPAEHCPGRLTSPVFRPPRP